MQIDPRNWLVSSAIGAAMLAGCGGGATVTRSESTPTTAGNASTTTGAPIRATTAGNATAPEDRIAPTSSFEIRDARRGTEAPQLNARVEVPGTGASMRTPRGSVPMPVGAGFVDRGGRFQILVAVATGTDERLDSLTGSLSVDAQPVDSEDVTIGGRPARIVVDHQGAGDLVIERVWTLVRDGNHALAALGAYPANADDEVRALVRDSIRSIEWDTNVAIDAERAAGFALTPPEGLAPDPQVVNGLIYVQPGSSLAPSSGRPAMVLVALPVTIPAAQRAEHCQELLRLAGPIADELVVSRAAITTGAVQGCELFGRETVPQPNAGEPTELATYAALVFIDERPYLVAGFVDAAEQGTWAPRFSAAARTVHRIER